MGTTVTVTTTINRTYLKNKTKDEIIDLLLYILDTRCEADAKIEKQAAEIERLKAAIAEAIVLNNVLHGMYKVTQLLGNALEKREAANE